MLKELTTRSIKADRIIYREGSHHLDLDQVIALYEASTLGERRPLENRDVMQGMLDHADIMITAWSGDELVGISRALTDYTSSRPV